MSWIISGPNVRASYTEPVTSKEDESMVISDLYLETGKNLSAVARYEDRWI